MPENRAEKINKKLEKEISISIENKCKRGIIKISFIRTAKNTTAICPNAENRSKGSEKNLINKKIIK